MHNKYGYKVWTSPPLNMVEVYIDYNVMKVYDLCKNHRFLWAVYGSGNMYVIVKYTCTWPTALRA